MTELQVILDALQSPIRREILRLVWERELPAGDIAGAFEVRAPTISQHLRVLRDTGLVTMVVDGNFRRYRANPDALAGLHRALFGDPKWLPADDIPETQHAATHRTTLVVAEVEVPVDCETAFHDFVDPERYSDWLGVPVTIDNGDFSCTLEWGTHIRGRYDLAVAPALIAMRWDFSDDNVPIPGAELIAYLRFTPTASGCRVTAHQIADNERQTTFLEVAWSMLLGRFREGVVARTTGATPPPRRQRPKRQNPARPPER